MCHNYLTVQDHFMFEVHHQLSVVPTRVTSQSPIGSPQQKSGANADKVSTWDALETQGLIGVTW